MGCNCAPKHQLHHDHGCGCHSRHHEPHHPVHHHHHRTYYGRPVTYAQVCHDHYPHHPATHQHQHGCGCHTPPSCVATKIEQCLAAGAAAGAHIMFSGLTPGATYMVVTTSAGAGASVALDGNAVGATEGSKWVVAPSGAGNLVLTLAAVSTEQICFSITQIGE